MASSHASIGALLAEKYVVERELGSGGMGTVVAAVHQQLEQRVAIKLLHDEALQHPEIVERFKREARSVARLSSPHVVRVLDVGTLESGAPFMVMEYLDGIDLGDYVAVNGPLPLTEAVAYVLEACEAVAEAHATRIVHRDLKPANLFLSNQPGGAQLIKVLDFGIAKALDDANKANLTRTTAMMGTAYYMSPEQLTASREVDSRTDLWALGVTMYELLSGRLPFESENLVEIVGLILDNRPQPLRELRPDLPPEFCRVVECCMCTDLEQRFQTVGDLAQALAPFAPPSSQISLDRIERVAPASMLRRPMWPSSRPPPPSVDVEGTLASRGIPKRALESRKPAAPQRAQGIDDTMLEPPREQDRTEIAAPPEMGQSTGRLTSIFAITTVATLVLVGGSVLLVRALRGEPTPPPVVVTDPGMQQPPPPTVVTVLVPVPTPVPEPTVAAAPTVVKPTTAPRPGNKPTSAPAPAPAPGGALNMDLK